MDYVGYLVVTMGVITGVNVRHASVKCWIIIIIIIVVIIIIIIIIGGGGGGGTVSRQALAGTTGILLTRDGRMGMEIDT
jgi:hypothetical protein